jgi:hypothetical protein
MRITPGVQRNLGAHPQINKMHMGRVNFFREKTDGGFMSPDEPRVDDIFVHVSAFKGFFVGPDVREAFDERLEFVKIPRSRIDFRFPGKSGHAADVTGRTGFDPKRTFASYFLHMI